MPSSNVHVIDHPLVQHKLSLMRNKETAWSGVLRGASLPPPVLMQVAAERVRPIVSSASTMMVRFTVKPFSWVYSSQLSMLVASMPFE